MEFIKMGAQRLGMGEQEFIILLALLALILILIILIIIVAIRNSSRRKAARAAASYQQSAAGAMYPGMQPQGQMGYGQPQQQSMGYGDPMQPQTQMGYGTQSMPVTQPEVQQPTPFLQLRVDLDARTLMGGLVGKDPGWYCAPTDPSLFCWWNGETWTSTASTNPTR